MYYKNKYTDKIIQETEELEHQGKIALKSNGVIDKILFEIAEEEELSLIEVRKIANSIFRFTSVVLSKVKEGFFGGLEKGEGYPVIKYKYIGKFTPAFYRIRNMLFHLNKKKEEKDAKH